MSERVRIDGNISDLFFNLDLEATVVKDANGKFVCFDDDKLRAEAGWFIECLDRLNVAVPSIDELIADFYARV